MKRVILIVLDSAGIGALPDAAKYGDSGSNTLVNIKKAVPEMELKNMSALGLGSIDGEETAVLGKMPSPLASFGKMAELSNGKDTTTGHWEIGGIVTENPFPTFTETGFPKEVIEEFEKAVGRKTIGNTAASGTEIINALGDEHLKTGALIVYTSADSVFQIAAHEDVVPPQELYEICKKARSILKGNYAVARVIARPFIGSGNGNYKRTENRRDFSLAPTEKTMLDYASEKGLTVCSIGKIEDIFQGRGITEAYHTTNNPDGITKTIKCMGSVNNGIIFTNLVDYDMLYGHRNDIKGYAGALMYFDERLPEIMSALKEKDMLIITADHGCDPTTESTDHSREYVPLLVYGKELKGGVNLGTRQSFSDIAATVSDYLSLEASFRHGESFLNKIIKR